MKTNNLLTISITIIFAMALQYCTKPEVYEKSDTSGNAERISGTVKENTYKISPADENSFAIALQNQSVEINELAQLKEYNPDSTSHLWHFTEVKNGCYRISNAYSGKVLASPTTKKIETPLVQAQYDTSTTQLWRIETFPKGAYKIINEATGLCIAHDDNKIVQKKSSDNANQLWTLSRVKAIYVDVDGTEFFRRTEGWIASDGDVSIGLTDGRVMWTSGDGHINDYDYATKKMYCLFQVHNSAMIQPASHSFHWPLTQTLYGNPFPGIQSYFKNKSSDDYWMWPAGGFQIPGNDTIYVFQSPLKKLPNGGSGWDEDGNPLWGKVRSSDMTVVQYSELQNFGDITFGRGFVVENDGYVYAYGQKRPFIEANIFVARFPASHPNEKWKFWTGSNWSDNVKDSKRVAEAATSSVSITKVKNKYVILSSEFSLGCDGGTHMYVSIGDSPTGPFTWRREVYAIPDRYQGHIPFWHGAYVHPELTNSANELLVTYAIGGYPCVNTCFGGRTDPDIARPRAIRVPLSLIDASL